MKMGMFSDFVESYRWAKAQRRILEKDRSHLAHRVRRFVIAYGRGTESEKDEQLKALSHAAWKCRDMAGVSAAWDSNEPKTIDEDRRIVVVASNAAIDVVLKYDAESVMKEIGINYVDPQLGF